MKEEESHIKSYLKIQQFRYEDILEYEVSIQPEIYEYKIPKLTLQATWWKMHSTNGIKIKRKGKIRITGKKERETLVFQVIDNGKGMDAGTLMYFEKQDGKRRAV